MATVSDLRVLVGDDDDAIREVLVTLLEDEGYAVEQAADGKAVLAAIASQTPDLILLDVRMPGATGLEVLKQLADGPDRPGVIMMTAYSTANEAIKAIQAGAFDYIAKPFNLDEVVLKVGRWFEQREMSRQLSSLTTTRLAGRDANERMIGDSPAMREIYKLIGRVAGSEATVLLTGETGTGKELVAEIIHKNSTFARGPLVKVNCAALPETLLESELFGHEKGAFTGAVALRKGRFELAHKGTIFLDEIGEISAGTQKKLLRVLQEREFERVGGTMPIKIDTRVIAATNKRLEHEVAEGRFRDDLFYRLNVISLHLPPLRERREDIPLLVEYFLDAYRYSPAAGPARMTEAALARLLTHDWPGNVRELQNTLQRATALAQGGLILEEHIQFPAVNERQFIDIAQRVRERTPLQRLLDETTRAAIAEALRQSGGDRIAAAFLLDVEPNLLREQIDAFGLMASDAADVSTASAIR
ncbi:MAG: sigma-54-dependent Fis family transcriptional regulator [Chloroflexi bacterium]|nr:sigma-54-dependent Fis family transcriptional regulator [Chloroflexota bacterium]